MNSHIQLGLIGDNIDASQSPRLHRLAGAQHGISVRYDRLVPAIEELDFSALLSRCASTYHGLNITYPYKEQAFAMVKSTDPLVTAIGAVNTVLFRQDGVHGFNTDYSGFVSAYRRIRKDGAPGNVLLIGAGGVGRAIAFALIALQAASIRLVDNNPAKAEALAKDLKALNASTEISFGSSPGLLAQDVQGVINCSPVGMIGYPGTPLAPEHFVGREWAFDVVYTPAETQFLTDAAATGLQTIHGGELFLAQGIDAWELFTGLPVDQARLREDMVGTEI